MPAQSMVKRKSIELGELRISYLEKSGPGPVLLFLPGGVVDHVDLTWKKLVRRMATRYSVLAPDLPGFGASVGLPASGYSTRFVLDFALQFMDEMKLERPVLLANSMSGAPAMRLALEHPNRIRALVLSGAYGWQPHVPFHRLAYRIVRLPGADALLRGFARIPGVVRGGIRVLVEEAESVTEELVEDGKRGAAAPQVLTAFVQWLRDEIQPHSIKSDLRPRLGDISMPTLILQGANDWLAPERFAREAAALIPGTEYHVFETRHLIPRERLNEVEDVVEAFLQKLGIPPTS